jgi:hypothetical protein
MNKLKNIIKYYLIIVAAIITLSTSAIKVGPDFLKNSPSEYLVIFAHNYNDAELHEQFGQALENRNFFDTVTIIDTIAGAPNQRPINPPTGYTNKDGTWVWRPQNSGEWVWIEYQSSYTLVPIK